MWGRIVCGRRPPRRPVVCCRVLAVVTASGGGAECCQWTEMQYVRFVGNVESSVGVGCLVLSVGLGARAGA